MRRAVRALWFLLAILVLACWLVRPGCDPVRERPGTEPGRVASVDQPATPERF